MSTEMSGSRLVLPLYVGPIPLGVSVKSTDGVPFLHVDRNRAVGNLWACWPVLSVSMSRFDRPLTPSWLMIVTVAEVLSSSAVY